jgi:hypothetical protein
VEWHGSAPDTPAIVDAGMIVGTVVIYRPLAQVSQMHVTSVNQASSIVFDSLSIAMQIFVNTLTGKTIALTTESSTTIVLTMSELRFMILKGKLSQVIRDCLIDELLSICFDHHIPAPPRINSVCPSSILHCLVMLIQLQRSRSHFCWEAVRGRSYALGLRH